MSHPLRMLLLTSWALVPLTVTATLANPLDPNVVAGNATVSGEGTPSVLVNQSTDKAIINWRSFDIGADETTTFAQPSVDSVTLNRVTGGLGPSEILGHLTANGKLFVINPDGILFGAGAVVDTAGLVATTNDISNENFMAGHYTFDRPGRPDASIVNLGTITANNAGFAALVAPGVRNDGMITARLGDIGLAAANEFSLDFYGDELIKLGVGDEIANAVIDVATGLPLDALVENGGTLSADGGTVQMTAVTARAVVDSVINNEGVIEANSVGMRNGRIVLGAQTGSTKNARAPRQRVRVSGHVSASGRHNGERGGTLIVTGEDIELIHASMQAFGVAGGGKVLIGGDVGGGHPNASVAQLASAASEGEAVATATNVAVDSATTINASAVEEGNGGKVVVWSNGTTRFDGSIAVPGGAASGDGGFGEVSGHALHYGGAVDLTSYRGARGTLLLDPLNVVIGGLAGLSTLSIADLQSALATGNVIVATGAGGTEEGDLTVAESLSTGTSNSLTLSAHRNVIFNDGVVWSNPGGAMSLVLQADNDGNGTGTVNFLGSSLIDGTNSNGVLTIFYNPAGGFATPTDFSSHLAGDPSRSIAYMLINNVSDLQNISQNLSGAYALNGDIDASVTASWNAGAGFVPIGTFGAAFMGVFEGLGHSINSLTINANDVGRVGLFGEAGDFDGSGRTVLLRNFSLVDAHVEATGSTTDIRMGALAGHVGQYGVVENVHASGEVILNSAGAGGQSWIGGLIGSLQNGVTRRSSFDGTVTSHETSATAVGGLVGNNGGTIDQSFARGSVSGTETVGGLVGSSWTPFGGEIRSSFADVDVDGVVGPFGDFFGGGLVGYNSDTPIHSSYSVGFVAGPAPAARVYKGGLIGRDNDPNTVDTFFSYWDTETSGLSVSPGGGTGLTTAQLKSGLPPGFDPAIWGIDPAVNNGYPFLLWQTASAPTFQGTVLTPPFVVPPLPPPAPPPLPTLPTLADPYGLGQITDIQEIVNRHSDPNALEGVLRTPGRLALIEEVISAYASLEDLQAVAKNAAYAQLAAAAYGELDKGDLSIPGWTVIDSIKAENSSHGLSATVFRNKTTSEIVISFRGSVSAGDWVTNGELATKPITAIPQMQEALSFARGVKERYGNITVTGHSLGGGMAHYVAAELGLHAVAFDPAPIGVALTRALKFGALAYDDIVNFRNSDDPLTARLGSLTVGPAAVTVQNSASIPMLYDLIGAIKHNDRRFIGVTRYNHSMDNLALAMEAAELVYNDLKVGGSP